MALTPTKDDPNREAELERRREHPASFNIRPSAEIQAAARRLNMSVEEYVARYGPTSREEHDAIYRDKRPDRRKAKGGK